MTQPIEDPVTNDWRDRIQAVLSDPDLTPAQRRALVMRLRALAVRWFYRRHPGLVGDRLTVPVGDTEVSIVKIAVTEVSTGVWALDVYVGDPESQDPHFRIFNPPLNMRRVNDTWESPVEATAEVIARNGGGRKRRVLR